MESVSSLKSLRMSCLKGTWSSINMDLGCVFSIRSMGALWSVQTLHKSVPPDAVIGKVLPGHKMSCKDAKVKLEDHCCMDNEDVTFICLLKSNFTDKCGVCVCFCRWSMYSLYVKNWVQPSNLLFFITFIIKYLYRINTVTFSGWLFSLNKMFSWTLFGHWGERRQYKSVHCVARRCPHRGRNCDGSTYQVFP